MDRVIEKVALSEQDCGLWLASTNQQGYGQVWIGSKRERTWRLRRAHRVTYEHFRGPIPDGLQLDHLCRTPRCVNPWHLEPVTQRENTRRGQAPTMVWHLTNTCKRGHSLEDAYLQNGGQRYCRTCKRTAAKAYRKRNRDRLNASRRDRYAANRRAMA